jgi:hypothetical protein
VADGFVCHFLRHKRDDKRKNNKLKRKTKREGTRKMQRPIRKKEDTQKNDTQKRTCLKLAGRQIEILHRYAYLREYCKEYLLPEGDRSEKPELTVRVDLPDITYEREKSAREDRMEGIAVRQFPDEYLETLAVYRRIAEEMLGFDTLLFHGSLLAIDGQGYLFTAKSGTGKSTHTRLWREVFGDRVTMINDDKPLLQLGSRDIPGDCGTVCPVTGWGTPWDGKHRLSTNRSVPLKAICLLERSDTNNIHRISFQEAYPMLLQQSYRPRDAAKMKQTLSLVDRLGERVGLYRLGCNQEAEAAVVAYEGLQEKSKGENI